MQIQLRRIKRDEISLLREFPPSDWQLDIEKVYIEHNEQDYFYPVVAAIDSEIAGTGIAIINGNVSWLGTILVPEKHRNKGIGSSITNHLVEYSKSRGVSSILLIATELGLPVYKKLGFKHDLHYLVFKTGQPVTIKCECQYISQICKADYDEIIELDFRISAENRTKLLLNAMNNGVKFKDDTIKGYYLPEFGRGLIIADSESAGIELLKYKISKDNPVIHIPETNITGQEFLESIGYKQVSKVPRMFLNQNIDWDSSKVYSRGCGYMG